MTDIANSYVAQRESRSQWRAVEELNDLSASLAEPTAPTTGENPPADPIGPPGVVIPGKLQQRRATDDPLGRQRPPPSDNSSMSKNLGEIIPSALKGVHNAVMTAVDPLADFLDENVYDFSKNVGTYKLDAPGTTTGKVVEGISRFMTGFIPAVKALKTMGVANKVANPLMAGAIADFATRDGHEGRLSDLWISSGMPKNGFTDWLQTDKNGTEFEERLKNTVEGGVLGVATQGLATGVIAAVKGGRTLIRQAKKLRGADAEIVALKTKYGELTTEDMMKYFGDTKLPVVETRAKAVTEVGAAPNLDPRALIQHTRTPTPINPPSTVKGVANKSDKLKFEEKNKVSLVEVEMTNASVATGGGMSKTALAVDHIGAVLARSGRGDVKRFFTYGDDGVIDGAASFETSSGRVLEFGTLSKGKSKQLLDEIEAYAFSKGIDKLTLTAHPGAKGAYDKLGFKVNENRGSQPGEGPFEGIDFPAMDKKLSDPPKLVMKKTTKEYGDVTLTNESGRYVITGGDLKIAVGGRKSAINQYKDFGSAVGDEHVVDEALTRPPYINPEKRPVVAPLAGHKTTDLGDVVVTESAKEPGKFQVTYWDGEAGKSSTTKDAVFNTREEAIVAFEKAGAGKVVEQSWGGVSTGVKSEDFETYVNFARIDEPEQVKFVMGKMAEAMKGSVDEARRGKITQEETKKMASDLGMTVEQLLERRKGQPLNAEEALGARQLWATSGQKLLEAAKAANGPNAGPLDQFAFRRAMAVHSAIQNEVIGARTETARALAQWKIPAGGGIEKARAIEQIMGGAGGEGASREMAKRLAILAEEGADPAAIARFVERGWGASSVDVVKEVWVNGLLSSPKTHAVNITSNSGVALQQVYERAVAGGIRGIIGGDGVKVGESIAMLHGLKSSVRDAFRMAAISLKTGDTGYAFSKIDVTHPNSISSEAFRMSSETSAGKFVDLLGHVATVPGRLLGAEDEFFKTIGYRMEVNAQAFRQASTEGLDGNQFGARVKELTDNPPEHIRINAADAAMYSTFTNEVGWFGKAIMNLRDSGSPIGQMGITLVLPFVRTPTNIARYTFERTPLAPLVGQWRADIAAGGTRSDLALARMSTGTAIMMTAMDYANDGTISGAGPTDATEREALLRSGWQPYSAKVGDKWYSYNRADPFGSTMGLAASITEATNRGEIDEEDVDEWQEVTAMSIAAVAQVAINKTYMEGMSNAVQVMSDPKRYSEGYINNLFASFVPFTSLSSAIENAADPIQREASTPWEAAEARIITLSESLPPRRDLWGVPIRNESGVGKIYDFISPIAVREQDVAPVDREIVRLGGGPQRIKKRTTFDGVSVSLKQHPDVYDEYVRLAGNDLKHPAWNMGTKDYLDAVISGEHPMSPVWDILPDEGRRNFIEGAVRDSRKLAQQQILSDPKFKKFGEMINYIKGAQQQSKMPVFGESQ